MTDTLPDPRTLPRLFGRPEAFTVECPACGQVHIARSVGKAAGRRREAEGWDPRTSTLTCGACTRVWIVGLALWQCPVSLKRRRAVPRDQVPDRDELRQLQDMFLRQQTGGVLAGMAILDHQTRPWRSNLTPQCTCDRLPKPLEFSRITDPHCPIHGDSVELPTVDSTTPRGVK